MNKILVCGGRDFEDTSLIERTLKYHEDEGPIFIIEGGASGADRLAKQYAKKRGIGVATVEANWEVHNKSAGPIRNNWMLILKPDLVIAFKGGKGTLNMIKRAKTRKIPVICVDWYPEEKIQKVELS